MATEIIIPRLGWTMEEGIFGEWLKRDGESIAVGDLLYTIETDKATQEVESLESGILNIAPDGPRSGDTVLVGALLGYLLAAGEPSPFETQREQAAPALARAQSEAAAPATAEEAGAPASSRGSNGPAISPRARRVAGELGVEWRSLTGSGRTGRIVERDIRTAAQQPEEVRFVATPVARRLAEEAGIDLATVAPHKPGGRIQREDVEAAIAARSTPAVTEPTETAVPAEVAPPSTGQGSSIPTTRIRKLIAQRMASSAHTTAAVTLTTEADATALVALREQLKATFGARNLPVPGYNDLLIKLTAVALQAHPLLNSTWNESEIILHEEIHIGLAVDTTEGLLAPVVRDAHSKGLRQIAAETQNLIEKAQSYRLGADDLQGGTFTITNLGMYGIDAFTPIINLPQSGILGVGRIVAKPAVVDDQVVPRKLVALSLTFDHRVMDGGPAARFLNTIREFIEEPALWLVG
jgi:pyruvate dehydrogenase E2 component (dihydrolipoamide acetyltransferase)